MSTINFPLLPSPWKSTRIKWLLESLESGRREVSDTNSFEGGALSVGGEHIGWQGEWKLDNPRYVSQEFYAEMSSGKIKVDDVLLVKDGATIGKVAIAEKLPSEKAAVNEHVFILRVSPLQFPKYLFFFIQSALAQDQIQLEIRGSAQPGLNSEFQNVVVAPEPPRNVQIEIADYLDRETARIDDLIAEKQRVLNLLAEKRRARITRAVTRGLDYNAPLRDSGIPWLGEIPAHWETKKLKYIASLKSGDFISANSIDTEGENPVFGGNGIRGYTTSATHEGDYVLIGRQGALCGNINYATGRFWATEHAVVVDLRDSYEVRWLGELLDIFNLNRLSQSAAQPGLAVDVIASITLPIPPFPEQKTIANRIARESASIDAIEVEMNRTITLLKERRASLISAAVTGQLKVA